MMMLFHLLLMVPLTASAFMSSGKFGATFHRSKSCQLQSESTSIDVSHLGLTMDDLNKPLPPELLQSLRSTGYESTNRLIEDNGCEWTESLNELNIKLQIQGLRGQPSAATAVLFSRTTISVAVFGRVVWSAILRGTIDPDKCSYETEDGPAMVPAIYLTVQKAAPEQWGGFILQIGEDSLV
jgi:hypothetical protein